MKPREFWINLFTKVLIDDPPLGSALRFDREIICTVNKSDYDQVCKERDELKEALKIAVDVIERIKNNPVCDSTGIIAHGNNLTNWAKDLGEDLAEETLNQIREKFPDIK